MIRLLSGERKNMVTRQKIDEVAIKWNKTKDPKDKDEWYKLIKEWCNGINNTDRRDVSSSASNRRDAGKYKTV